MFYIILCGHRVWNLNPSPAVEISHYCRQLPASTASVRFEVRICVSGVLRSRRVTC